MFIIHSFTFNKYKHVQIIKLITISACNQNYMRTHTNTGTFIADRAGVSPEKFTQGMPILCCTKMDLNILNAHVQCALHTH